jgi:beta-lactamase superfamily II metal-dependent hydrolase
VYEIDFLAVEGDDGPSAKSGDAITMRLSVLGRATPAVVVIDAGFRRTGEAVCEHVDRYYRTDQIDLVISTHPDTDHINGLSTVLENMQVIELLVHQPREWIGNAGDFQNIEVVDEILAVVRRKGAIVTQPFTGLNRLGGAIRILGPTEAYYKELVEAHLDEVRSGLASARKALAETETLLAKMLRAKASGPVVELPEETLSDDVETGPRNNTSVITLLQVDGRRALLTGDAGIPALTQAADEYEGTIGSFASRRIDFLQAPHHGSRRNVGPTILNRLLGSPEAPYGGAATLISSAKADEKHPSPKVTNALLRRGARVVATEGETTCWPSPDAPDRGWATATPVGPMTEPAEDDD